MGFIEFQWENENSVSVVNEKKAVGAVELKEETDANELSTRTQPVIGTVTTTL